MTAYTDEQLMIRLVEHATLEAFEELLIRYEKPLFNYIYRYMSDFHLAQDLFQETFFRIYKNRATFNHELRFSTWAYRIATNLCINELRKKTHELETSLDNNHVSCSSHHKAINKDSHDCLQEKHLIKQEQEEKIKELVKTLPAKLKSVFILSEYQELSCKEIAKILGIPIGTVKSRLHYSFKRLVELLEKRGLLDAL